MRKHLLHTTALAAAAMLAAGGSAAADKAMKPAITISGSGDYVIGGILNDEQNVNGRSVVTDTSALDTRTDAEIHFNGRAQTDNGLKFHMRVELEGQDGATSTNNDDLIDEYFLSVSGAFGQVIIGGTGGAPIKMLTGLSGSWATGVGESLAYNGASWVPSAAPSPVPAKTFNTIQNVRMQDHDADKVTYISPKFGGFQVGLSYSPDEINDGLNGRINAQTSRHDGLEGAVSYTGKFGDVGFGVGAGVTAYQGANRAATGSTCDAGPGPAGGPPAAGATATTVCTPNPANPTSDESAWVVAARIDFGGGFRVSAAHKRTTDDAAATQGQVTDVGARFVSGANSFSLVGSMGELDRSGAQYKAAMGSYARSLGAGAKVHTNLIWNESDNGVSGTGSADNTGMALVSGISVKF